MHVILAGEHTMKHYQKYDGEYIEQLKCNPRKDFIQAIRDNVT